MKNLLVASSSSSDRRKQHASMMKKTTKLALLLLLLSCFLIMEGIHPVNATKEGEGGEDYTLSSIANVIMGQQQPKEEEEPTTTKTNEDGSFTTTNIRRKTDAVPDTCRTVLYEVPNNDEEDESSKSSSSSHWGVFSLVARERGTPVETSGDIVIPLPDININLNLDDDDEVNNWLWKYMNMFWDGSETGMQYEGHKSVMSVVPGLGMLANYADSASSSSSSDDKNNDNIQQQKQNLIPLAPHVDEGGLTRLENPGAGAITHYHNYTIFVFHNVEAGDELLLSDSLLLLKNQVDDDSNKNLHRHRHPVKSNNKPSLDEMKQYGYCLDNMKPGKSKIKEAGRGAFANRDLSKGSVIAPVPLLEIPKSEIEKNHQLIQNYCLSSSNQSSTTTLYFPYGPMVNLINHYTKPNVKFQWRNNNEENNKSTNQNFMELVATRDIEEGEEIYLDYGRDWEDTWWKHGQKDWKPAEYHYTPSYVMDDVIKMLRTEKELKDHPYPDNLFTSCFYRYSDRSPEEKLQGQKASASNVISYRWKLTKRIYDLKNLRPCTILKRNESGQHRSAYAVRILNRPGLPKEEQIPKGELHIVTHVPRSAIRFSDKAGTTDMHLSTAFRHEIGLLPPDLLFNNNIVVKQQQKDNSEEETTTVDIDEESSSSSVRVD